jgi:NAD+ kinase
MKYAIISKEDEDCKLIASKIKNILSFDYDEENPELVITVGGDGTTLQAIHKYDDKLENIYFIAYNAGHLGFFSSFNINEFDEFISFVNKKNFTYDNLNLIEYSINTLSGENVCGYALNEVTILNPRRTLILDVYINNMHFEHYRGTGMCLSTPTGSTGYNKSLHGAVIKPSLEVYQMTEIASINSNLYHTLSSPLILGKDDVCCLSSEWNNEIWITADSKSLSFKDFKSINLKLSSKKARLINRGIQYLERVKKNFI